MTNRILLALALLAGSAVMHAQSSVSPYTLFGAGLSYSTENLTVGVDYRRQEWSSCSTGSDVISYKDMDKLIFGLSYTPDPYSVRSYWKRIRFLFGASVDNSYLTAGGVSAKGWSLTFGMVLPVRSSTRFYWSAGFPR